jgi:hypothetical protein
MDDNNKERPDSERPETEPNPEGRVLRLAPPDIRRRLGSAIRKLTRAALLSVQAAQLCAEATAELARSGAQGDVPPVTELDRARARRLLRRARSRT